MFCQYEQGYFLCGVGAIFFETPATAPPRVCECSPDALVLVRGEQLQARVLATNNIASGNFTAPQGVRVMGRPSPVLNISYEEVDTGIRVSWQPPVDTGFGPGDSDPALLISYLLKMSLCLNFASNNAACATKTFLALGASTCRLCSFSVTEIGNLVEGRVYFFRATAANEVGQGFESQAPTIRVPWKVIPQILYPRQGNFPLRVAELGVGSVVWFFGQALSSVLMQVTCAAYLVIGLLRVVRACC